MTTKYAIETLIGDDGERFLIVLQNGQPAWYQNLYYSTNRRVNNFSRNTSLRELSNIQKLHSWADDNSVGLEERFLAGDYLDSAEIGSLVNYCRVRRPRKSKSENVVDLVKQKRQLAQAPDLDPKSVNATLHQIINYIDWWCDIADCSVGAKACRVRLAGRARMLTTLRGRSPRPYRKNTNQYSRALPQGVIDQVFTLADPESNSNPWKHRGVRVRNYLIISMLYTLGIRKGELLSIKNTDLNLPESSLYIRKLPDDPSDTRLNEPNAKTVAREMKIPQNLNLWIQEYLGLRRKVKGASKHGFLLVSHFGPRKGEPLTIVGFNKVINDVRDELAPTEYGISAHSFRHTFFTNYARALKKSGMGEEGIKQRLNETGGWSRVQHTAALYTRQFIIEESQHSQVEYQESLGFPRVL